MTTIPDTYLLPRLLKCMRGLPFISACRLADFLHVPGDRYGHFCGLLKHGVEAGVIEHRTVSSGGIEFPEFRLKECHAP